MDSNISHQSQQRKEKDIKDELLALYPDKQINNLASQNKKLYDSVRFRAINKNISVSKYLEHLGFTQKQDELHLLVKKLYPNNIVENFREKSLELYLKVLSRAYTRKMTIGKYLESGGLIFIGTGLSSLVQNLTELYPDKNVSRLEPNLYNRVYSVARNRGMNIKDCLALLGFTYTNVKPNSLEEELKIKYPNKIIDELPRRLYNRIYTAARRKGLRMSEFLKHTDIPILTQKKCLL